MATSSSKSKDERLSAHQIMRQHALASGPQISPSTDPVAANPTKDARQQQLVSATIDCIFQYGLQNTTVAKVTSAARLSAGIINFYFSSKDKLLLGVLESVRDEFCDALTHSQQPGDSPVEILNKLIDIHFDPEVSSPRKIAVWHAFSSASRHRADYTKICGEFDQQLEQLLISQFEQLRGLSKQWQYHPRALALGLTGILDSLWQENLYNPESFDPAAARQQCYEYLGSLFPDQFGDGDEAVDSIPVVNTEVKTSDLLPAWTYSNSEFFDLEIEKLFKPNWMLAGHVSELAHPRDYITFDGFGERALVVRGNDNRLRAFHNVCRHRGARLLEGSGNCPHSLSCPFHGWTYNLAGDLVGIPAKDTFDNLEPERNGLVELDMEVWMGFVFIRFQAGGESMKNLMAPVEDLVAPYDIAQMSSLEGTEFRELRPYNWKVIHDIDNEGYHVPVGHPSLQQLYGKNYSDDYIQHIPVSRGYLNEKPGKIWSVKQYQNLLPDYDHLPEDQRRLWLYIGIFPNMVIALYPDSIEFYMTIPRDTRSTWYVGRSFGLEDQRRETRAARFLNRRINYITDREDESFVDWLQEGMKSSAFPGQELSSLEQGVRGFHKAVQEVIPVANIADEPAPGSMKSVNTASFNLLTQ